MTFNQRLALLVGAGIAAAALIECAIRGWHALMARVDRNVERMVDDGLTALAQTDEWSDPWFATPTFRDMCANNPAAVDALAAAEASRADWSIPQNWSNR